MPNNIKYSNSLSKFKKLLKSWKLCPCRLCKTYIAQIGFICLSHHNIQILFQSCINLYHKNFYIDFAQTFFLKSLFYYLIVIIIISFCRLALFRHTFNISLLTLIQFNSISSKTECFAKIVNSF